MYILMAEVVGDVLRHTDNSEAVHRVSLHVFDCICSNMMVVRLRLVLLHTKIIHICPRNGLRAGRVSPCTMFLLPFSVAASSPWFSQPAPSHVHSLALNPSRLQKQLPFATCGAWGKTFQPRTTYDPSLPPRPDQRKCGERLLCFSSSAGE